MVEEGLLVCLVEFGDVVELAVDCVGGGVEWSVGDVVEDEVVEAGVEVLGDAGEGVEAGGDAVVFVAADLAAVAADGVGEFGLGEAGGGSEGFDSSCIPGCMTAASGCSTKRPSAQPTS